MKTLKKKNFVLDTNVILHDSGCLNNFQEHNIIIPIIVFEELDKFKKGDESIAHHARAFIREMNKFVDKHQESIFTKGASLGKGKGVVKIALTTDSHLDVLALFHEPSNDNIILSTCIDEKEKKPKEDLIFVSKDINLRLKAVAMGILTEDYRTDKVKNLDFFKEDSYITLEITAANLDLFLANKLNRDSLKKAVELHSNQYLYVSCGQSTFLARFDSQTGVIRNINVKTIFGITPRNSEQKFALDSLLDPTISLVAIMGKAGTGKTLLAVAAALAQEEAYEQILLARPIVSLSSKDLGFLPGSVDEKIAPYMQPLFDNINVISHLLKPLSPEKRRLDQMQKDGKIEISPLAYIRGRSLVKSFFIIDEAQNLTPHEIKTIITRAGEGSKLVFTGDIQQIDAPFLDMHSNGLSYVRDKMYKESVFSGINLLKGERSHLAELASNLL